MDNSHQIPSFEIPKNPEQGQVSHQQEHESKGANAEINGEMLPAPSSGQQQGLSNAQPLQQVATNVSPQPMMAQAPVMQDDTHIIAEDNDVIEKEWVDRAKKIVSLTSNDPFVEAKELNKLKATYIKKRFNKDMPLAADEKTL